MINHGVIDYWVTLSAIGYTAHRDTFLGKKITKVPCCYIFLSLVSLNLNHTTGDRSFSIKLIE